MLIEGEIYAQVAQTSVASTEGTTGISPIFWLMTPPGLFYVKLHKNQFLLLLFCSLGPQKQVFFV